MIAVVLIGSAKVRTKDLSSCSQEVTRCLAACRAICARRLIDAERVSKFPSQSPSERISA